MIPPRIAAVRLGEVCGTVLATAARTNESIWVLDADLGDCNGAEKFLMSHPSKFVEVGIAEQAAVSMAAGIAACGGRPFVFSFAAFLCYRALDQIRVCASQTRLPVTLVCSHAGGCCGRNGKTHSALDDLGILAALPSVSIWSPADAK